MNTATITSHHDFETIAEAMCDMSLDIFTDTHIVETITADEHDDELVRLWEGAELDLVVSFHVEAYEPHNDYAEYYPIIDGTVTYKGVAYSVRYSAWDGDGALVVV